MITVRKSAERRHVENQNQKTWMTFDLENKADPLRKGFGALKILNEEALAPGCGFILHTYMDMVIVTYVREGVIIYKGPLDEPGFMESKNFHTANVSSDTKQYALNVSPSEEAHIFQSGFGLAKCNPSSHDRQVKQLGLKKVFTHAERLGVLRLIASSDGRDASMPIQQDVQMYSTYINKGNHMIHELKPGRTAWLHVVKGHILMNDLDLQTGDGAGLTNERSVSFTVKNPSEILLFDLCGQIPEEIKSDSNSNLQAVEIR